MNPGTEVCLRLCIFNHLQVADKEFRRMYLKISAQNLANATEGDEKLLEIDAEKITCLDNFDKKKVHTF